MEHTEKNIFPDIAAIVKEQVGWSKTTTYTVIKKCIDKKAIQRIAPNFVCHPLITKKQAQEGETTELINKMYDGSADQLVAVLALSGGLFGGLAALLFADVYLSIALVAVASFFTAYMLGVFTAVLLLGRISVINMLTKTD